MEIFTKEWRKELIDKYPWLRQTGYRDMPSDLIWLDELPYGWVKHFGTQMIEELDQIIKSKGWDDYVVLQAKEKFGELRWYDNADWRDEDYKKWVEKYTHISKWTCEECGAVGEYVTAGWIGTLCKNCAKTCSSRTKLWKIEEVYGEGNLVL